MTWGTPYNTYVTPSGDKIVTRTKSDPNGYAFRFYSASSGRQIGRSMGSVDDVSKYAAEKGWKVVAGGESAKLVKLDKKLMPGTGKKHKAPPHSYKGPLYALMQSYGFRVKDDHDDNADAGQIAIAYGQVNGHDNNVEVHDFGGRFSVIIECEEHELQDQFFMQAARKSAKQSHYDDSSGMRTFDNLKTIEDVEHLLGVLDASLSGVDKTPQVKPEVVKSLKREQAGSKPKVDHAKAAAEHQAAAKDYAALIAQAKRRPKSEKEIAGYNKKLEAHRAARDAHKAAGKATPAEYEAAASKAQSLSKFVYGDGTWAQTR